MPGFVWDLDAGVYEEMKKAKEELEEGAYYVSDDYYGYVTKGNAWFDIALIRGNFRITIFAGELDETAGYTRKGAVKAIVPGASFEDYQRDTETLLLRLIDKYGLA